MSAHNELSVTVVWVTKVSGFYLSSKKIMLNDSNIIVPDDDHLLIVNRDIETRTAGEPFILSQLRHRYVILDGVLFRQVDCNSITAMTGLK